MNELYKMRVNTNLLYNAILQDNAEDETTQENALNILNALINSNIKAVDINAIKYMYDFYIEHIR